MKHVGALDYCIRYFGFWEEGEDNFTTSTAYSRAYFNFKGDSVSVYAMLGKNMGTCKISLDEVELCTLDLFSDEERSACIFERCGIAGEAVHNLVIELCPKAIGCAPGKLVILGFDATDPIHYPRMLKAQMEDELHAIERGERTILPPDKWCPPKRAATLPLHGVKLNAGFIREVYDRNIDNLKFNASLEWYTEGRAPGFILNSPYVTDEEKARPGWAGWAPGQIEASELGGAAGVLRFEEDSELRRVSEEIIGRMKTRRRADGYYNYYDEAASFDMTCFPDDYTGREMPYKYYAYPNGNPLTERKNADRAFWTRGMMEAINANIDGADSLVRGMYDWFNRQDAYLSKIRYGFNATNGDIGGPMVYHSPVGVPADIITNMRYYDQEYWMRALTERQPLAMSHYPGERPHSTALLCVQALADMYLATGEPKYIDAVKGAWDIYKKYYMHVGGLPSIIEHSLPHPPGAFEIYKRSKEACGHTNWMWINERLMQLYPEEEKYVREIEECLYNTMVNSVGHHSNVYHILLHGKKEKGSNWNSCCQISVQIALSTLPQYIYTYAEGATYVNLYLPSEYKADFGTVSMKANFPYTNDVEISVSPKSEDEHTLKLRIPSWVSDDVAVTVGDDAPIIGKAGTYLSIKRTWREGDVIRFTLPVKLGAVLYTGLDQAPLSYPRYTFTYGPVLMALKAPECKDESVIPRIPMSIDRVLRFPPDENLHYAIPNTDYTIMPYWDAPTEGFTCVPIVAEDV